MLGKNIYLVTLPKDLVDYDCYAGHVVYANGPQEAKKICAKSPGSERSRVRLEEATATKIGETKKRGQEGIILSDFRAG